MFGIENQGSISFLLSYSFFYIEDFMKNKFRGVIVHIFDRIFLCMIIDDDIYIFQTKFVIDIQLHLFETYLRSILLHYHTSKFFTYERQTKSNYTNFL